MFEKLLDGQIDGKLTNFPNPQRVAYQNHV
jgi:hypothetical protein